ncbi:hypothetical protein PG984_015231 [Apiospora sp. TS-2023a]
MEKTNEATKMPEVKDETKHSGPCIVCGKQTPRLCLICGEDFVCREMCNVPDNLPAAHIRNCREDETTTGYDLKVCMVREIPATNTQTAKDFGFDRCATEADKRTLLGVYYTLVVGFGISGAQLNRWSAARALRDNIAELYDNRLERAEEDYVVPEEYLDWFKKHAHVFDGGIHGSGNCTQAEETGDFWPNLRGRLDRAFS